MEEFFSKQQVNAILEQQREIFLDYIGNDSVFLNGIPYPLFPEPAKVELSHEEHQQRINESLKQIKEFADSEEGDKYFKNIKRKTKRDTEKIRRLYYTLDRLSNKTFENIIKHLAEEHGEKWRDKCYKKQTEPYAKVQLRNICKVFENHGKTVSSKEDFVALCSKFKGLTYKVYIGQGSFFKIMKGNKELIRL